LKENITTKNTKGGKEKGIFLFFRLPKNEKNDDPSAKLKEKPASECGGEEKGVSDLNRGGAPQREKKKKGGFNIQRRLLVREGLKTGKNAFGKRASEKSIVVQQLSNLNRKSASQGQVHGGPPYSKEKKCAKGLWWGG